MVKAIEFPVIPKEVWCHVWDFPRSDVMPSTWWPFFRKSLLLLGEIEDEGSLTSSGSLPTFPWPLGECSFMSEEGKYKCCIYSFVEETGKLGLCMHQIPNSLWFGSSWTICKYTMFHLWSWGHKNKSFSSKQGFLDKRCTRFQISPLCGSTLTTLMHWWMRPKWFCTEKYLDE